MQMLQSKLKPTKFLVLISLISVLALVLIFFKVPSEETKLWVELWKSLLNFLLIVALGGIISQLIRSFDRRREEQRVLQLFRTDFLRELLSAYHPVKNGRRVLRRAGLTPKWTPPITLDQRQLEVYKEQMENINSSQLDFERLAGEVKSFPHAFSESSDLRSRLGEMERYLRELLFEYEREWQRLLEDPPAATFSDLVRLQDLTGHFKGSGYKDVFVLAKDEALRLIREDILAVRGQTESAGALQ